MSIEDKEMRHGRKTKSKRFNGYKRHLAIDLGAWSSSPQIQSALQINALFLFGLVLAPFLAWTLKNTRVGMVVRLAGESTSAPACAANDALGASAKAGSSATAASHTAADTAE